MSNPRFFHAFLRQIGVTSTGVGLALVAHSHGISPASAESDDDEKAVTNWSGTHRVAVDPSRFFEPSSAAELAAVVSNAHAEGYSIRPVGNALSPNALGLSPTGMVSVAKLDRILTIDTERNEVTVEAGVSVGAVLHELRKHDLTLQNFSSITEQQMGGWTQVAAHGTGCALPTVDEMIVRMTLVTPAEGPIELSATSDPALFALAKCGLGALGVVSKLTLRCTPAHRLKEATEVVTHEVLRGERGAGVGHLERLRENRHVRYMWMPHTDKVVVVISNATEDEATAERSDDDDDDGNGDDAAATNEAAALSEMRTLLRASAPRAYPTEESVDGMTLMQLRGELLDPIVCDALGASAPLDCDHVAAVNTAEATAWSGLAATEQRVGWSDDILGFDCGGQQWVLEVCLPMGSLAQNLALAEARIRGSGRSLSRAAALRAPSKGGRARWDTDASAVRDGWATASAVGVGGGATTTTTSVEAEGSWGHRAYRGSPDTEFVMSLLEEIKKEKIPAPAPIEQRWTARSSAAMSPAHSAAVDDIFTWVGIIMYMPPIDAADPRSVEAREAVTRAFGNYTQVLRRMLQRYERFAPCAIAMRPLGGGSSSGDGGDGGTTVAELLHRSYFSTGGSGGGGGAA